LRSVAKGKVNLGGDEATQQLKEQTEQFSELLRVVEQHLGAHIRAVRLSQRLTTSPACLAGEEFDPSPRMERLLLRGKGAGPRQRRILELNPKHPIVMKMHERYQHASDDPLIPMCADLLYGYAALAEGSELADPVAFNGRLVDSVSTLLGVAQSVNPAEPPSGASATAQEAG
jgi:molecular chaperone HtpG